MAAIEDTGGGASEPPPAAPPFFGLWPRFGEVDETEQVLRETARIFAQREAARRERSLHLA